MSTQQSNDLAEKLRGRKHYEVILLKKTEKPHPEAETARAKHLSRRQSSAAKAAAVMLSESTKRPERFDDIVSKSCVGTGMLGNDLNSIFFPKRRQAADLSSNPRACYSA